MKKKKILLDTSIQIGKLKYQEIVNHIDKLSAKESPVSSFYVLFEYKVGLILNLIKYWNLVNISSSIKLAMDRWNESQKKREPKNFALLHSVIIDRLKHISGDKKKYLRQVEFAILFMLENFYSGIEEILIGDFRYNEIVRYPINSKEDFLAFAELCKKNKEMIDQTEFWTKHKKQLNDLVASDELKESYTSLQEALLRIQTDIKYAHMTNSNKVVGDAVIAIDVREGTRMLVTDKSFEIICHILNKEMERIPNKY